MRIRNDAKGRLPTLKCERSLNALQIDSGMNQRSDQGCNDCSRDVTACQSKRFAASVRLIWIRARNGSMLENHTHISSQTVDEFRSGRNRTETLQLSLVGPPDTTSSTFSLLAAVMFRPTSFAFLLRSDSYPGFRLNANHASRCWDWRSCCQAMALRI